MPHCSTCTCSELFEIVSHHVLQWFVLTCGIACGLLAAALVSKWTGL